MEVKVKKVTDIELLQWACSLTIGKESHAKLSSIYKNEHSPMRTQIFQVTMLDIPTFVSTHFVRHTQGVTHFVKSNREDRGGDGTENRWTPVDHGMLINAQALINMARKRLCHKAHRDTRYLMTLIKLAVCDVDLELSKRMVPECIYRGGVCHEDKPCGRIVMRSRDEI